MKDKTARLLMILPWLSVPLLLAAYLLLWDSIPERMAVHFDLSGAPNGWMSRGGSLAFDLGILLFVLCVSSWKLYGRGRVESRAQTLAQLALFNAAVALMTAVFLGLLKYNISNTPF